MANNKDFILNNAVEVGGPTKVTLGNVTNNNVDLSTGNYFADTPSGVSTYTFSNPADVQSFQLEVTGGTAEIVQNFSTTLYTGNGSTQTITNGIDLANDGGLVWIKGRTQSAADHELFDTERGVLKELRTNGTGDQNTLANSLTSFNSNGFSVGNAFYIGTSGESYASWTFKKAAGFFDCISYTGTGVNGRTVSHNLGVEPGVIIVKQTSASGEPWMVYHRSLGSLARLNLNNTNQAVTANDEPWYGVDPTSTEFTVAYNSTNANGASYIAYLFAHDVASDGLIQCSSYTGTGATGNAINLGWEPQWVIIKRTDALGQWRIFDSERGVITDGFDNFLLAENSIYELNNAEDSIDFTLTGFTLKSSNANMNASGGSYVYIAIRAASDPDITWPASVQWTAGTAPQSPAVGEKDVYTFVTDDGGTSYIGLQTADNLS